MKQLRSWMITIAIIAGFGWWFYPSVLTDIGLVESDADRIIGAWKDRNSNLVVEIEGRVILLLPELDTNGRQQRFLIDLESGHRLLVSHDLELSQNVPVEVSSHIRLKGEYDWSEGGGIIHWTHRDPSGAREGGWIEHLGYRYD